MLPVVSVPELAVAEHGDFLSDECDIRFARDTFDVFAVTESAGPELISEQYFDSSIFGVDTGHIVVDLFAGFLH